MSLAAVCGHSMSRLLLEPAPSVVNILHNNLHCSSVQVQCARLLGAQCCEYFAQAPQSPGPGPGILHTTPSSHHCFLALVNQIVLIEIWKFANRQYNFRTAISEQSWEHLGFLSPHLRTGSQILSFSMCQQGSSLLWGSYQTKSPADDNVILKYGSTTRRILWNFRKMSLMTVLIQLESDSSSSTRSKNCRKC